MCGYNYSYIVEENKKARQASLVIPVDHEEDASEDDMDINDDVHLW